MAKAAFAMQSIRPAQYLIYDKMPSGRENPILSSSPMEDSGISKGDRILWVDGELIFSNLQLSQIVNNHKALLTIEREGKTFLARVPRLAISDLRLTKVEKEELDDWRYEAKIENKIDELAFIPYNLKSNAVVENSLGYIDSKSQSKNYFEPTERTYSENALQKGDKIIAVQGEKITSSYQLLEELQTVKSLIIVKKGASPKSISWKEADRGFEASFDMGDLEKITESIGMATPITTTGSLKLLNPVTPIPLHEFPLDEPSHKARQEKLEKHQKEIEEISDQGQKEKALKGFQLYQNRLMLGLSLQDKTVAYNPSPFVLFKDVFKETYRTLFALISGYLSPKHLAGPVGIVQVIHHGWSVGAKEALFWLGMISLNLGIINLFPIPVLDGGYILFAVIESITKKPLKAKTMERLVFPFVVLIIAFFIYLTYHDLSRLITRFF